MSGRIPIESLPKEARETLERGDCHRQWPQLVTLNVRDFERVPGLALRTYPNG